MLPATPIRAPEFPPDLQWLNTDGPIQLAQLRGKVVLLDFWTYCCINCMHVIPDLKRLEAKYGDALVVIGVHSAKFTNEREAENIRQAIMRYGISHPVVDDRDMRIWQSYGVRAWPTLVLLDPAGNVVGQVSGEGHYDMLDRAIGQQVKDWEAKGQLDRRPMGFIKPQTQPSSLLAFPGKVLVDEPGGRLFIADSGHNRVLVARLDDYSITRVIGSGQAGLKDGDFAWAAFQSPQGMALAGSILYVADTENHAIRAIDLEKETVTTVAGTGKQDRKVGFASMQPAKTTDISSPWDLLALEGKLYIAMAGSHQIWVMDLSAGTIGTFAGSGREDRFDGPAEQAALAQPSGVATDGRLLYFADSETSSVRLVELDESPRVETIAGGELFVFGDRDGKGLQARLQHPLGLAYYGGALYLADTYNHKIKRIALRDSGVLTIAGTGKPGRKDGPPADAQFHEPSGLSVAPQAGRLFIADTNNHAIRVMDLGTGEIQTAELCMPAASTSRERPSER